MIKITMQDVVKNMDNKFDLILIAARRARQIQVSIKETMIQGSHKCTVLALQEIENNLIVQYKEHDNSTILDK